MRLAAALRLSMTAARAKADPEQFKPQYGGFCAVSMSMGRLEPGDVRNLVHCRWEAGGASAMRGLYRCSSKI